MSGAARARLFVALDLPEDAREALAAWGREVASPDGNVWGATVNKTSGDPEKLDDVVFPLFPSGGGFPRSNADNT